MTPQHTLVQHSGFGYAGNPQFEHALESRTLHTAAEVKRVEKARGLLFGSYEAAEEFAEKAMYPPGNNGLIPTALGTFSDQTIDGLRIYIPVREVVG